MLVVQNFLCMLKGLPTRSAPLANLAPGSFSSVPHNQPTDTSTHRPVSTSLLLYVHITSLPLFFSYVISHCLISRLTFRLLVVDCQ